MKKRTYSLFYIWICLLFVAIGAISGYASSRLLVGTTDFGFWMFMALELSVLFLCVLLHIFVHELGHLIFGLATGYRFSSFRIFSLTILHTGDEWKLKRYKIPGTAGQCLMAVPTGDRLPYQLYNAGGALANIVVSVIAVGFASLFHNVVEIVFPMLMLTVTGLLSAVTNLVPLPSGIPNDGMNLLSMSRSEIERQAFRSQLLISEQLANGTALPDMPDTWFTLPAETDWNAPLSSGIASLNADRLAASGALSQAKSWCSDILNQAPDMPLFYRNALQLTAMLCEMAENGYSDTCRAWYTRDFAKYVKSTTMPAQLLFMYEYDKASGGNTNRIDATLKAFEKACRFHPYAGETAMLRDLQRQIDQQLHR